MCDLLIYLNNTILKIDKKKKEAGHLESLHVASREVMRMVHTGCGGKGKQKASILKVIEKR